MNIKPDLLRAVIIIINIINNYYYNIVFSILVI